MQPSLLSYDLGLPLAAPGFRIVQLGSVDKLQKYFF